ncbi:hypothetical protein [Planctellipticum variicoloris]|uniref:hypothetical protein n=1 Tax=Planctellipticum variicoloris TaxID=3064265 RepID=UPI002B9937CC|nr:hypothetical protein SH412_003413 [Planctomycetaceae bacterium SH412]HTN02016.1 hypothetical protein [Planctomycetaceae bacterium]
MNAMMLEQPYSQAVDPVEEMRLRTWARQHYLPAEQRNDGLHPIVLDEMTRRDREVERKPR